MITISEILKPLGEEIARTRHAVEALKENKRLKNLSAHEFHQFEYKHRATLDEACDNFARGHGFGLVEPDLAELLLLRLQSANHFLDWVKRADFEAHGNPYKLWKWLLVEQWQLFGLLRYKEGIAQRNRPPL